MDKKKFDMSKAHDAHKVTEITFGGETFEVRSHIPYEQKSAFANEFTAMTLNIDEELGISYVMATEN